MGMMLRVILVMLACCVLRSAGKPHQSVPSEEDCARGLSDVRQLRADLARLGVVAFVTNAATPRTAPHIHSQCWVDWLPREEVERRAYEQEKRDFGLDMVKQLEKLAVEDIRGWGAVDLERRADVFLRLYDWLSSAHGYGNYYISRWVLNIAINSLAVLALDEKIPPKSVRALMSRIPSKRMSFYFRLDVLNDEAPHRFSAPLFLSCEDANRRLNIQWCRRMKNTDEHYQKLYKNGQRKWISYQFESVRDDNPVFAFYWDDSVGGETLGAAWDKKRHYCLSVGDVDRDCRRDLELILVYREEMGALPLPSKKECSDDVARRDYIDRIDYGWTKKHLYGETLHVGSIVAQICSGMPLDFETQRLKQRSAKNSSGSVTKPALPLIVSPPSRPMNI